jgi:hypothetical protein
MAQWQQTTVRSAYLVTGEVDDGIEEVQKNRAKHFFLLQALQRWEAALAAVFRGYKKSKAANGRMYRNTSCFLHI